MSERQEPSALVARGKELQVRRDVPGAVRAFMEAGLAYLFDYADIPSARQALTSAYQLDPQNLDVIYNMGRVDVVEGRVQEGLGKYIDVLRKSNVQHLPALFEAGCVYQSMNQYDQAMLAFKRIIDRDPNHLDAMVHMAQLHAARSMRAEAIGFFLRAAEMAWDGKQHATARQLANHVLGMDPRNAKARYLIADLDERGTTEDHHVEPAATVPPPAAPGAGPPAREAAGFPSVAPAGSATFGSSGPVDSAQSDLRADIERLTEQRADIQAQLASERALIESAIRRKSELHTELAQAQSAVGRVQSEALRDLQRAVAEAQAALEGLRAEHDALERTVMQFRDEEREAAAGRDQARSEVEALERRLEDMKAQVEMHEALGRQAVSSAGVWEERVRRLRDEVDELEGRAKFLRPRGSEPTRAEKKSELASRRTAEGR